MTDHSNAWHKGREAAMASSSQKPPKSASAKWQEEFWKGHAAGKAEAEQIYKSFIESYPQFARKEPAS